MPKRFALLPIHHPRNKTAILRFSPTREKPLGGLGSSPLVGSRASPLLIFWGHNPWCVETEDWRRRRISDQSVSDMETYQDLWNRSNNSLLEPIIVREGDFQCMAPCTPDIRPFVIPRDYD